MAPKWRKRLIRKRHLDMVGRTTASVDSLVNEGSPIDLMWEFEEDEITIPMMQERMEDRIRRRDIQRAGAESMMTRSTYGHWGAAHIV